MKRVIIAVILLCFPLVAPATVTAQGATSADWAMSKNIFVGWVEINQEDWSVLGYANADDWLAVIKANNQVFQRVVQQKLPGRQVTGAKSQAEGVGSQDLRVEFADVRFDTESYRLHLSIHFVDPATGSELASIPVAGYRGGHFSVDSCLKGALEKVAEKLGQEIQKRGRQK